ncbi:Thiol:disulfide interchange protein DsbC [Marinobacter salarius]|uniref:DsbC family protein n=1 Tax=Marinobacter salarius TaxID=1420917 RepID=UPI0012558CB1|nr:DsbC family protein [Marinobacter salarius]VVT31201.1 Thiol:disulfide interchange protein [Marinobacter salarius]VXB10041.1 Thiol:disulfide interchange protein DsbC [Marinobacter salarius]
MLIKNLFKPLLPLVLAALAAGAHTAHAGEVEDTIADKLTAAIPGLKISDVRKSEAEGLYEVYSNNGDTIFTTADGQYLLTGDLLKVTANGIANISEQGRASQRAQTIDEFGDEGLISFPAKGTEKASIAVFTDIDCPYCRKLHDEVPRLNELGITVNYYGFPRSGPNTPSFRKYISVWCSDDPQAAMNAAKQGRSVDDQSCENPVREQFELGSRVGVTGTPAIVLEDGNMVRGYVPSEKLAEGLGLL